MGVEIEILALAGALTLYFLLGKMDAVKKYVNDLTEESDSSKPDEEAGES